MIITIELKRGLKMVLKFKKGFSLVELLVVIAIIGILAAVGITAYSGYTQNAKIKATTAQHSQVVAVINSEFARCAAGSGTFSWSGACAAAVDAASLVTYFGLAGTMPLANAYNTGTAAVSTFTSGTTPLSATNAPVTVDGQIAIFCVGTTSCQAKADTGEGDNLNSTVLRY